MVAPRIVNPRGCLLMEISWKLTIDDLIPPKIDYDESTERTASYTRPASGQGKLKEQR